MEVENKISHTRPDREKILLVLLPYWTPLIPPMGISCLKTFLQSHGYDVKTDDPNIMPEFKEIYNTYFDTLKEIIPGDKRGNFFSIGHDVLQNHLMAYLNYKNENDYIQLTKTLILKTFFCQTDDRCARELNKTIANFYLRLEEYFLDLLAKNRPVVLGISVNSCTLPASLFAFKLTRKHFPGIKTIMGGGVFCDFLAPGTSNFEALLETTRDYVDNIIIGEGEILMLKLLRGELPGSQRVFSINDINRETLQLSTVGVPDFTDLNLTPYPYLSAYTSRSCPFQCKFCSDSAMWGKYRKKKAKQVVNEFTTLSRRHGYQLFMLSDLLLNPIISDLANELINSGISIYWDGCLRADKDTCSIKNTQLWRRGGFYRARLGLESGSPHVLKLMGKKVIPGQIKEALSCLAFAGIQTTTLWIVGYPGETEEDFVQTLELIEELKEDIYEAECRPFYFYPKGQVGSEQWGKNNLMVPLYPKKAEEMLIFQTWLIDGLPSREETYRRVNRFVDHCKRLGIPNIYTLHEVYAADERWAKLHKNAVPSMLDFKKKDIYIDECTCFQEVHLIKDTAQEDGDFGF